MSGDVALQLFAQTLWAGLLVSAPILGVTLLVGLIVSVLQAVTQVQDMSLMFIPKLIAAGAVMVMFGPWMLRRLTSFAIQLIAGSPHFFD